MNRVFRSLLLAACVAAPLPLCRAASATDTSPKLRIGIVPFANYTGSYEATDSIVGRITAQMALRNLDLIPHDSLRKVMRSQRLRMTGAIDSRYAARLRELIGVDLLLTGAIDIYTPQENPEVGVTLRLFDCRTSRIVWASGVAVSGADFAGAFGIGRTKSISALSTRAINQLFEQFPLDRNGLERIAPTVSAAPRNTDQPAVAAGARVVVIPFDNFSDQQHAGDIASDLFLVELWRRGFCPVEPGDITAALTELRTLPRGEISAEAAAYLRDKFQADVIATGSIYQFVPGRGALGESLPQLELGLRLIDAATGKLLAAVSSTRAGDDSELFFGAGRCYSIGKLTEKGLRDDWKRLSKQGDKRSVAISRPAVDEGRINAAR